jgi:SAM-dependent methyltransferase
MDKTQFVKTEFDFGWKTGIDLSLVELTLQYNRGSILDIGCGTCQLFVHLQQRGWNKRYYGIDIQKFEGYEYPKDVNLIIGDALSIDLLKVNTVVLYNILEHIDEPYKLITKALKISENVLINVPRRNEEMWKYGIVEYHQLDKTHKHCGFSRDELYKLVSLAGGEIVNYKEHGKIDAGIGINLWENKFLKKLLSQLKKVFKSRVFYCEIWAEVKPKA